MGSLLSYHALLVECLARIALHAFYALSNSAKKVICTPKLQRSVRCCYLQLHVVLKKKKKNMLYSPFTYKPTVTLFLFSLFLLARFHGNFGLN